MQKLRDEIINAEKSRSDLFKWKLIAISSLSAVGLGISKVCIPQILLLIPAVSIYVDIISYHLVLRILVIGYFFRRYEIHENFDSLSKELILYHKYEKFTESARDCNAFILEDMALFGSTLLFSGLIFGYGLYLKEKGDVYSLALAFIAVGILGAISAVLVHEIYECKEKKIKELK